MIKHLLDMIKHLLDMIKHLLDMIKHLLDMIELLIQVNQYDYLFAVRQSVISFLSHIELVLRDDRVLYPKSLQIAHQTRIKGKFYYFAA
ncbi:hypothetical protein CEXT_567041 [Caerostris extrusa]|uniref:Uncharacterized protein n=1 Tax=Caerostris extrusa TaxID=172846 RepID=A0AAV4RPB8_CAEEX|nr:hypothetical protein CEXT_567041 [Caerostris extrusa]